MKRACLLALGYSANKQQSPKQKPVKPPTLVNSKELTLLAGGWDNRLRIDRQSFGPLSTVWEPQALHLRHTPFIQVKQDYWNDRQVCNLGTKSWFRPVKLQVTESSQWRTAVRHYSVKSTQFEKPNAPHDPNQVWEWYQLTFKNLWSFKAHLVHFFPLLLLGTSYTFCSLSPRARHDLAWVHILRTAQLWSTCFRFSGQFLDSTW